MNFNDGKSDLDLDNSIKREDESGEGVEKTESEKMNDSAMDLAKAAERRINQDKQEVPDSTLFTK